MRRGILGAYGGDAVTPNLDALSKDGVAYPNCIAPSPWTFPSHVSLFTGKTVSEHKLHETRDTKIPKLYGLMAKSELETIAEYLSSRGYNTIGYSANAHIAPGSGFDRSFNSFTFADPGELEGGERHKEDGGQFEETKREAALRLLKQGRLRELWRSYRIHREHKNRRRMRNYPTLKAGDRLARMITESSFEEPFFLFANFFEMHEPYTSFEPSAMMDLFGTKVLRGKELDVVRRKYTEEARTVDEILGSALRYLKECGAYESSLIIVTSDHGQALKERGYFGHGTFLHPEIVEVPLVVKFPRNRRPAPGEGYQSLTRIPEMVKDALIGIADGASLTAKSALSESFGIANVIENFAGLPDYEEKRAKFDRPKKALYQDGYRMVVDGAAGAMEEFSRGGVEEDPSLHKDAANEMLAQLRGLVGPSFAVPEPF